jgi:CBS domain-containing protein
LDRISAKDVMVKDILTIHPNSRVALARLRMFRHGIGALPVVEKNDKLVGIITLRDVDLAGNETGALNVEDLMTTDLITATEDTPIAEIAETMLNTGIQRIPVVDEDGKLIGLVTQTSIIRAAKKCFKR